MSQHRPQPYFHLISALIALPRSAAETRCPNGCTQQKATGAQHQEGWRTTSAQAPASGLDAYRWLVPFTSTSWHPTLHHTPDLFPLRFQPPEGRGLVTSCHKEETQDFLPNTCPTPVTLLCHKCWGPAKPMGGKRPLVSTTPRTKLKFIELLQVVSHLQVSALFLNPPAILLLS